jgi:hypothetical protein
MTGLKGGERAVAVLAVAATAVAVLASPARSETPGLQLPPLPLLCLLPVRISLLPCPQAGAPGSTDPSPEPRPIVATPTSVRYDPRRIIVRFKKRTASKTILRVFARAGVTPERMLSRVRLYVVKAPSGKRDDALASLRRSTSVGQVEREIVLDGLETIPNDPDWPDQWGLRTAGFPKAWDVSRGSRRIVVAVLDTGVDSGHPELKAALVPGRDIVHRDDDPSDDNGHGTAVAGVVAARTNNGAGLAGACWSCAVMPVKVLGADGIGTTADVAAGILWAADHGAKVINLSLGAPGTTEALTAAIEYAVAKDAVIVAAAGNSSSTTPFYPAAEGGVIGVAATNPDDRLYSWSNHGSWIQVAAPGCSSAPWLKGGYVGFCGTSAAAPLVAGLAALVRSAWPQATAEQTAEVVDKAVDSIPAEVRNGRINAALALGQVRQILPTARRTITFRGRLNSRIRSRAHKQRVGSGALGAVLSFSGARRLTLVLRQPRRAAVRVSGKSPLRIGLSVEAGTIRLVVAGTGTRAVYRLALSSAAPRAP